MAEGHAEFKMVQHALMGELKPQEDRVSQKIGRKKHTKSPPLLMEIPDLNTALVEAYRDLNRTSHVAKQMAQCSKTVQKQAQRATMLWQVFEQIIAVLEQQLQDCQPLGIPPPSTAPH